MYFQFHQKPQIKAIQETIRKFEEIKQWFDKQKTYHFYSSSLIVIYDANLADLLEKNEANLSQAVRITMADFAHVFPANNTLDENYLFGLNRLTEHLSLLLSPEYSFKDVRKNGC